jgi:hypothetical protein
MGFPFEGFLSAAGRRTRCSRPPAPPGKAPQVAHLVLPRPGGGRPKGRWPGVPGGGVTQSRGGASGTNGASCSTSATPSLTVMLLIRQPASVVLITWYENVTVARSKYATA